MFLRQIFGAAAFVGLMCFAVLAVEEYELDDDIARISRELDAARRERREEHAAAAVDRREFQEYGARTKKRLKVLKTETDSVRNAALKYQARCDSLGTVLAATKAKKREYRLLQERMQKALIALCDSVGGLVDTVSPMLSARTSATLSLLRAELSAGNIDNAEGMSRLLQIARDLESCLMSIQIVQGNSPVPQISGTCRRIRIGGVFEAVVSADGRRGAVWSSVDGKWVLTEDAEVCSRILKAVNVREGKTLPVLIELPFSSTAGRGGTDVE